MWQNDLNTANEIFINLIWDKVREYCNYGQLLPVEGCTDELYYTLDARAGCDYIVVEDLGIRGMAVRVQYTDAPFDTFTIRASRDSGVMTEFQKRQYAIKNNYMSPAYTMQAYVSADKSHLISGAIAMTSDIIAAIESGNCHTESTYNASFYVINFNDIECNKFGG